jgi:hypothetical protein
MTDTLVDRLRGQYKVGPDNVYGTRSFADFIPPISLEAAARIEVLEAAVNDMRSLMESSVGVVGLHMNGDVATWSDLEEGGRFEEWLMSLSDAE